MDWDHVAQEGGRVVGCCEKTVMNLLFVQIARKFGLALKLSELSARR